jgi:hypothetical protein
MVSSARPAQSAQTLSRQAGGKDEVASAVTSSSAWVWCNGDPHTGQAMDSADMLTA